MLTCKVGETIINCFDGTYNKYKLKKWSEENRLICPVCGGTYEYCHGEFVIPYFRHKEKSILCDEIYYEPETEEHIKGKTILFNWLKTMDGITNLELESYITETRQRPDIYFEQNGQRYAVEYQCSPIASQYVKRHELYQLANIIDIWILGFNKYGLEIDNYRNISHSFWFKEIEKVCEYYLEAETQYLFIKNNVIKRDLPYKKIDLNNYYCYPIKEFSIDDQFIYLKNYNMFDFYKDDVSSEKYYRMKSKYTNLIFKHLIEKYNYEIDIKYDKILIYGLYKTRWIAICFKRNKIEINKEYWGWNHGGLHSDKCKEISVLDSYENILKLITDFIDEEIIKSKKISERR